MNHWFSDILMTAAAPRGGYDFFPWLMFHFLRLAGWTLVAERGGATINTITDGSMDANNVTSWSAVGTATREKSTTQVYAGYRSLTFTTLASGDGVQSAVFTGMSASTKHALSLMLWNNCGHNLTVYVDTGTGSWTSLGTVATNGGVWTRHRWTFTAHSAVTVCKVKIVDEAGTVSSGQVYLDSVYCTQSCNYWEDSPVGSGTDGVIESGNNKFSSASYSFTDTDVTNGRYVCLYDPTNLGNSGVYLVSGRDGAKAILSIRAGSGEYLTAATGLAFRVLDKANWPSGEVALNAQRSGICLESPHSTKWRWKVHHYWTHWGSGSYSCYGMFASAPGPCGLNVDTFLFYKDSPSTTRNLADDSAVGTVYGWGVGLRDTGTQHRLTMITDAETFILGVARPVSPVYPSAFLMGFIGDNVRDLDETFVHMMKLGILTSQESRQELRFDYQSYSWCYAGASFGRDIGGSGLALASCIASAGYGGGTATPEGQTNAKANPFSSEEVVRPLIVIGDWNAEQGEYTFMEASNHNFGHCRQNLTTWTPFGTSREWQHMTVGLCIAWHGRQVTP